MRTSCLIVLVAILAVPAASAQRSGSGLSPKVGFDDAPLDWSPDGRIAFGHTRKPPESSVWAPVVDINVMRADGTGKRRLAPKVRPDTEEWDYAAHWSPDGSLLTFVRVLGEETSTLYVVRANGTGLRPLTHTAPDDGAGIWAPDGQTIAFGRFSKVPSQSSGIWLVRPDGTGLRQLTQGEDYGPVWSPDARTIAFNRLGPQRTETAIFTADVGSGSVRQITAFGHAEVNQWSTDGALLMYETPSAASASAIRTMRPDGSERRKLVAGSGGAWSPDGKRLLFVRGRSTWREDLFVAEASGRNARVVIRRVVRSGIWSRDGRRVAAPSYGGCNGTGVYVANLSKTGARRLSNDCRVVGTPDADRLRGTRERDLISGLGGSDFIDASPGNPKSLWTPRLDHNVVDGGAGNDRIVGGRGQDVLIGGRGRDEIRGGGQDDRILVRDGDIDFVRCGWGNADSVIADRFDVIAADCERVYRG